MKTKNVHHDPNGITYYRSRLGWGLLKCDSGEFDYSENPQTTKKRKTKEDFLKEYKQTELFRW